MRPGIALLAACICVAASWEPVRNFIRISQSEFSKQQLARLAMQEIKRARGSFVQVSFLGAGGGTPLAKPDHFDYQHWREMYELAASQKEQIAEAISIDGNAVLRIHESGGSTSKQVLRGRDPLQFALAGREFEIVYFGFSGPGRLGLQETVVVFVRTRSRIDAAAGVDLFNKLRPMFPGMGVKVEIRNDAWFIYQDRYPFFNPFNGDRNVPSQHEYESTRTLTCADSAAGPRCQLASP